jgi:hypothetical protein
VAGRSQRRQWFARQPRYKVRSGVVVGVDKAMKRFAGLELSRFLCRHRHGATSMPFFIKLALPDGDPVAAHN